MFERSKYPPESGETIQDLTLGEVYLALPRLMGEDVQGEPLRSWMDYDLAPVLTFTSPTFQATVRLVGPIGNGVFFPEERKINEFLPEEPGEYWMDETGVHPVGFWPNRGGHIRRFFCRIGFHRRKRLEGYVFKDTEFKVKQCPYCLKAKIGWGLLSVTYAPQEVWDAMVMYERFVRNYDRKFPLPGEPVVIVLVGDCVRYCYPNGSISSIYLSDL